MVLHPGGGGRAGRLVQRGQHLGLQLALAAAARPVAAARTAVEPARVVAGSARVVTGLARRAAESARTATGPARMAAEPARTAVGGVPVHHRRLPSVPHAPRGGGVAASY